MIDTLKGFARETLSVLTATMVRIRWRLRLGRRGRPSGMRAPLVLSLTSYPPRFATLELTLKSLMTQTVRPDVIELWIADADMAALPRGVLALRKHGLSIRPCSDTRSYKKIIPALAAHPDATIVTADDDAYYWPAWLEQLIAGCEEGKKEVVFHRGHGIVLSEDGNPEPYRRWRLNIGDNEPSRLMFPTGLGGVLYRPGILSSEVMDEQKFRKFCPSGDDIWLFWMASLNGATFRKIGPRRRFILWRGGQEVALQNDNLLYADANDRQIAAMIDAYGFPAHWAPAA